MAIWRSALAFAIAVLVAMQAASASAETDEEFYRGKTLRVIVGFPAGGGFHTYGQVLAAHMPRFMPGAPTMIVQDMPGAVTAKAAQYIYAAAPQDGTVIGLLHQGNPFVCGVQTYRAAIVRVRQPHKPFTRFQRLNDFHQVGRQDVQ